MPFDIKNKIKRQILFTDGISFDVLVNIISDVNTKYDDIDKIYDKINQFGFYISYDDLIVILSNYGYDERLDKHIIKKLDDNQNEMIRFINNNQFLLSENILNKLQSIPEFFHFNDFYENVFVKNGYYDLYIYSKFIGSHKLCLDKNYLIMKNMLQNC